jgi:hypothetical protein
MLARCWPGNRSVRKDKVDRKVLLTMRKALARRWPPSGHAIALLPMTLPLPIALDAAAASQLLRSQPSPQSHAPPLALRYVAYQTELVTQLSTLAELGHGFTLALARVVDVGHTRMS